MSSSAPNGAPASEANPNPHPVSSSSKPTNANPDPNHQSVSSLVQGGDPNAEVKDVKKKDKKEKKQKGGDKAKDGAAEGADGPVRPLEMSPPPSFFQSRIALFEEIKSKQEAEIASKPKQPIKIQLPPPPSHPHSHSHPDEKSPPVAVAKPSELDTIGGDEEGGDVKFEEIEGAKIVEGTSWETTPFQVARGIAKSLAERAVIAKVNGQLWDLERPLEGSCTLEILDFDHPEGRAVFWHSSAHLLGEAAERHYGCHLCLGPPTEDGFFYEMGLPDGGAVVNTDYPALENVAKKAVAEKQKFERLVVQKEDLLKMFEYNKYKQHLIQSKIPDGTSTTVYRCGPMIDLCRGPHIPNTGMIKAFSIMKNSSSYFLGNNQNDSLQRIYGVSFPDKKRMEEYKTFLAEAAKRDHRKIGTEQELWFFHPLSPGSCFWLPHGTRIYNTLLDFFKSEYRKRGYSEVISPNMYNSELWKTSGHWDKYAENMFKLTVEKEEFALKPMNCPGHCLMFAQRERSYRELPIRMADFGVLHRNEASGALSGLTRVRRFQQDDAHHFCMPDQIESEILGIFDFIQYVYGINGFTFELQLSTRPEKFLGNVETWDFAEQMLTNALNKFRPGEWGLNPGDGAFYGPKIDITISDALRRKHQCATIQLDFQLPQRFDLGYRPATEKEWITEVEPSSAAAAQGSGAGAGAGAGAGVEGGAAGEKGEKDGGKEVVAKKKMPRPVMIHRAIAGSIERFTAILTEHYAGKWPFWLSPRQVIIIPAGGYGEEVQRVVEYAAEVKQKLWDAGFYAEADLSDSTMQKKIFNAERGQWNFIFVVGPEERKTRSVNIRVRDDPATKHKGETKDLEETVVRLRKLKDERRLKNGLDE